MLTLKLFRQADPFRQLDSRSLGEGALVIGRSPEADWQLPDPERLLSRRHCIVEVADGGAVVRDLSTNGVYIGRERERAPPGEPQLLAPTDTLRIGEYLLVVEQGETCAPPLPQAPQAAAPRLVLDDGSAATWADAPLLEAFCEGAGLEASAFSDETPAAVLRRAGEVYREMVTGLSRLMAARAGLKAHKKLDGTSVSADHNNPLRWASSDRTALDLLRNRDDGFLEGPGAVNASFEDVRDHLLCEAAALAGAWEAALAALSPAAIEARTPRIAGLNVGRAAGLWRAYQATYAELASAPLAADDSSAPGRAYAEAYGRKRSELSVSKSRP